MISSSIWSGLPNTSPASSYSLIFKTSTPKLSVNTAAKAWRKALSDPIPQRAPSAPIFRSSLLFCSPTSNQRRLFCSVCSGHSPFDSSHLRFCSAQVTLGLGLFPLAVLLRPLPTRFVPPTSLFNPTSEFVLSTLLRVTANFSCSSSS